MEPSHAKEIFGPDFLGTKELAAIAEMLGIAMPEQSRVPLIPFDNGELLRARRDDYLLILGIPAASDGEPLTLIKMRERFGVDPSRSEPCFYNQDWYLNEPFVREAVLEPRWYLIRKTVQKQSRGKAPDEILKALPKGERFPSTILTAFAFFAYYLHTGDGKLWENDFVWCSDSDSNGDRIYTGRYRDPKGLARNGFNIHRHLAIRPCYGVAPVR